MPFQLVVGPPASGKTTRALRRAREVAQAGGRVWWVGLPNQRTYVYRRATEAGGLLGLEFLSVQQVAYRLLADALRLKPLVVGTARLVMVGEALLESERAVPTPGEARLFAYAIAEAKRYRLGPRDVPVHDAVTQRLRDAFEAYERIKGEAWDYDDFRTQALALARSSEVEGEAELIVVDGFREIGPVDLELYRALGERTEVMLALPEAPPTGEPDVVLEAGSTPAPACYRARNPVAEARWVLRSLKRDLAEGADPLDLAVILPRGETRAFAALAEEFGVPVMDETPRALADTPAGRRLADLLAVASSPTASRLLAVPGLEPLGRAVLDAGIAGPEAVARLAAGIGLADAWRDWRERLEPGDTAWAASLVDLAAAAESDARAAQRFREQALRRAQEASALGAGEHFRAWWAALLDDADVYDRPRGGVALLDAVRASGRRFAHVYLMRAVAGAYEPGLREDWFVPEEARAGWRDVFENPGAKKLPRRLRGTSEAFVRELLSRGERVVVTVPDADQEGPLEPAAELVTDPAPLPELPAGSPLDATAGRAYRAPRGSAELSRPTVERLRRYAECGFRTWAEDLVARARRGRLGDEHAGHAAGPDRAGLDEGRPAAPTGFGDRGEISHAGAGAHVPASGIADAEEAELLDEAVDDLLGGDRPAWWRRLRADLRRSGDLDDASLHALAEAHPEAAVWLRTHADSLRELTFGVRLDAGEEGPWAYVDAARRDGSNAVLYRFTAPGTAASPAQAEAELADRWTELWAAGRLLEGYGGRIERVDVRVWPILGESVDAYEGGITYPWRRVQRAREGVRDAYARFRAGDIEPKPGFICRSCAVFDICREGTR